MSLPKFASVDQLLAFAEQTQQALAEMTKQRDEMMDAARTWFDEQERAAKQLTTAQAQADALRTQLAEAKASQAFIENERFCQMRDQRDALRTRYDELEQALRFYAAENNYQRGFIVADYGRRARAALRTPSPAPRAVVTRPDEPPAQARERIRQ